MRLDFHPEALEEYQAAARYYARRNSSVAHRFAESVEDAIRRILEAPLAWQALDGDVRRCLTHVFPYGVIYSVEAESILILAVMHGSREPGYWHDRLVND